VKVELSARPNWPVADGKPAGLVAALVGQVGALVLTVLVVKFFFADEYGQLRFGAVPTLVQFLPLWLGFMLAVGFAAKKREEPWHVFATVRFQVRDLVFVPLGMGLQYALLAMYLPFQIDESRLDGPARDLIDRVGGWGSGFFALTIAVAFIAPFVEEIFFRGLLLRSMVRVGLGFVSERFAIGIGVLLSALWFAGIHGEGLQFAALFVFALVCCFLTLWFGRIGPSTMLHIGFNLITMVDLGRRIRNGG
jgi:uncharacterized protein